MPHLEASLQHDVDEIRARLVAMANLDEEALRGSLQAVLNLDRQLAYKVILRDRLVDELEKELDRMCLEFLVRHQPAAGILRFVYSTSKIVKELERIGDYAESIARQALQVQSLPAGFPRASFEQMGDLVIPMVRDAITAFVENNIELAHATMAKENEADQLRNRISDELMRLSHPADQLAVLQAVPRRFERASDQAYNICEEALYAATGEYQKHPPMESFRIVFVGETNACLSQMAEGIANALGEEKFTFASAGLTAGTITPHTIEFMQSKGIDISRQRAKPVNEIPDLDQVQVIIGLCHGARKVFPAAPTKTVGLEWQVLDPLKIKGDAETVQAAYATAFDYLQNHIRHLVKAILGERNNES